MRLLIGIAAGLALLPLPAVAQESERKQVLEAAGSSSVSIWRGQQYPDRENFNGMLLNDKGLVLTAWRWVCLPGPYKAGGGSVEIDVTVVGVHPTQDLALVQLNPQQVKAAAQHFTAKPAVLSRSAPSLGDPLYLVRSTYSKAIPVVVASDTQPGDHPEYFSVAAAKKEEPIFGGTVLPQDLVVNLRGEVAGVATRAVVNARLVGRLIPVNDFNPDSFIPPSRRRPNHEKARELTQLSEAAAKRMNARTIYDPNLPDGGASEFLRMALAEDPTNSETYFKLGMARETFQFNHHGSTSGFLAKGIAMNPWSDSGVDAYFELGKVLYGNPMTKNDGIAVWAEGTSKFPTKTAKLWESLAKAYWDNSNFFLAARSCRMAREVSTSQSAELREIYEKSQLRLSAADQGKLNQFENSIGEQILKLKAEAESAKRASKDFMTDDGRRVITRENGSASVGTPVAGKSLGDSLKGLSNEQVEDLFVQSRINVALEHIRAGRLKVGKGILDDVVASYPKLAESKTLKDLLQALEEKLK